MYILPYIGSLDAFLAIWYYLPQPLRAYIGSSMFFFAVIAVIKRWLDD